MYKQVEFNGDSEIIDTIFGKIEIVLECHHPLSNKSRYEVTELYPKLNDNYINNSQEYFGDSFLEIAGQFEKSKRESNEFIN